MNSKGLAVVGLAAIFLWPGCAGHVPPHRPPAPPVPAVPARPPLESHLLGSWSRVLRTGATARMTFEPGGKLTFTEELLFLNPAHWELDPGRQELRMTFPNTPDEKLQVFQLYVGQEVKALDRRNQQVTYHFDEQTDNLTVAGWPYTKDEAVAPRPAPEPEPVIH